MKQVSFVVICCLSLTACFESQNIKFSSSNFNDSSPTLTTIQPPPPDINPPPETDPSQPPGTDSSPDINPPPETDPPQPPGTDSSPDINPPPETDPPQPPGTDSSPDINPPPETDPPQPPGIDSSPDINPPPETDPPQPPGTDSSPDINPPPETEIPETDQLLCPDNFVSIPPLNGYTNQSFCVAKYEMKDDGSGNTVSQATGTPYKMFDQSIVGPNRFLSRNDFISKCQGMGEGYDLITNDEWQTLARNIELVASNWSGEVVGSGSINRGNSNILYIGQSLAASSDDNEACFGTGQAMETCNGNTWHDKKRTHTLSNGKIIWDVSGNIYETIKDDHSGGYSTVDNGGIYVSQITSTTNTVLKSLSGGTTTTTARTVREQFGPSGNYTTLRTTPYGGLGYGWLRSGNNTTTGYIVRGGYYGTGASHSSGGHRVYPGGIFTFYMGLNGSDDQSSAKIITGHSNGFRCVYHP